ncbi:FixH family protein [Methylocella silvestris BL2]|uniref:FixH family protein n=1 Tax=Methylocella silvestris (strain DSM 15510 / CIP 108128 / LMG 27833 / NCIMB 13906 / BL2) TaxID=395965 RepID=B8EJ57_METSB|nr:FixH family protein [Methylocella silvestris]ACK52549.1 FixH family protein [Methylocella silvestris BL2]
MSKRDLSFPEIRGPLTGWMVFAMTLAAFGVVFAVNGLMAYYAVSTFTGLADPSPYEHGLAYEKDILAAKAQDALGWDVSAHLTRDASGKEAIEARFKDRGGAPVPGLAVSAGFDSPADIKLDADLTLKEIEPGVYLGLVAARPGQWDLLIDARRDGERVFKSNNRVEIR